MHPATQPAPARRSPGRPREFDAEAALNAALLVFRQRGYHAASVSDLSTAMALTPGSIYKAFTDKRTLFALAFQRYLEVRYAGLQERLAAEATGRGKLSAMLEYYAEVSHGLEGRRGCLVVGSASQMATFDAELAEMVAQALRRVEAKLVELVRLGQADGSISTQQDAVVLAQTLLCVLQGLRVVGKVGMKREDAMAVVNQAMRLTD